MKKERCPLTGEEVCDFLKIKMSTLYSWVSQGKIRVTKAGKLNRFQWDDVEDFLNSKKDKGETK